MTQMQSQEFNPVLFLNSQDKDDFLLCIQTELQLEMLKAYGHTVICIDDTHSTNMYDFLLITVLVIDEFGEGVPASWAITNRRIPSSIYQFPLKITMHLVSFIQHSS